MLHSHPDAPIDSRYIQSADIVVQNLGGQAFDILTEVYLDGALSAVFLHHLNGYPDPGSTAAIGDQYTNYQPFSFRFITNTTTPQFTEIIIYAKNNGSPVATITKELLILAVPN
jgi:hypothetical protein